MTNDRPERTPITRIRPCATLIEARKLLPQLNRDVLGGRLGLGEFLSAMLPALTSPPDPVGEDARSALGMVLISLEVHLAGDGSLPAAALYPGVSETVRRYRQAGEPARETFLSYLAGPPFIAGLAFETTWRRAAARLNDNGLDLADELWPLRRALAWDVEVARERIRRATDLIADSTRVFGDLLAAGASDVAAFQLLRRFFGTLELDGEQWPGVSGGHAPGLLVGDAVLGVRDAEARRLGDLALRSLDAATRRAVVAARRPPGLVGAYVTAVAHEPRLEVLRPQLLTLVRGYVAMSGTHQGVAHRYEPPAGSPIPRPPGVPPGGGTGGLNFDDLRALHRARRDLRGDLGAGGER